MEEKSSLTAKLDGKYLVYFKNLWTAAKVDEKSYQDKIRGVFPADLARLIQFDIFLAFSIQISTLTSSPPPPLPPNKCIDVCPIAAGEITGDGLLISGGGGSYGNCYIKTNAWAVVAGLNSLDGNLKNSITIPGTLPDDARILRVKKNYQLKLEATSFAFGGGFAGAVLKTYQTDESLYVYAPILGFKKKLHYKTINEEYTLEKRHVEKSIFRVWSKVDAWFISGSWSKAECTAITWSICEE